MVTKRINKIKKRNVNVHQEEEIAEMEENAEGEEEIKRTQIKKNLSKENQVFQ